MKAGNFWAKLEAFIDDMSTTKQITIEEDDESHWTVVLDDVDAAQTRVNIQLLQGHMKNFIHVVDNYDAAADIIEVFEQDPVGYYIHAGVTRREFITACEGALEVRRDTHFPMPHWIDAHAYSEMLEDSRWPKEAQETP